MALDRSDAGAGRGVIGRSLTGALIAVAAVQLAVLECFFLPLRIGSVPVPLSIPVAVLVNAGLPALAYRLTASRAVAAFPVVVWIAVVIVASVPRPEGDVIVTGTGRGIAFLILGAVAGAYAVGRLLALPSHPILRESPVIGGDSGR
ncbi:MAG: hypothetical protein ACR2I7_04385 [Geodermatophilaceae bacterium]